jgi:hypothetical protein
MIGINYSSNPRIIWFDPFAIPAQIYHPKFINMQRFKLWLRKVELTGPFPFLAIFKTCGIVILENRFVA